MEIDERKIMDKFGKVTLQLVKDMREIGYDIIPYLEDERFCFYNDIPKLRYKYNKGTSVSKTRYKQIINNFVRKNLEPATNFFMQNEKLLWEISLEYAVDPYYISSIYCIETNFGKNLGSRIAFNTWVSIYKDFPKDRHGRLNSTDQLKELIDFAEESGKDIMEIKGSFMGCIGHCQTLPNNRKRFGVDYDKDGVINPFVRADNLAFIAKYLSDCGFKWNKWEAVYAYNHHKSYADKITALSRTTSISVKGKKKRFYELMLKDFEFKEARQDGMILL